VSQPANGKSRRNNSNGRFRRGERQRRRLFLEPLERRELLAAIAQVTALPHEYYKTPSTPIEYLSAPRSGDPVTLAKDYFRANAGSFGIVPGDVDHLVVTNNYSTDGLRFIYFGQTFNGLPIVNAVANVAILPDGRILTAGASLVSGLVEPPPNSGPAPYLPVSEAIRSIANAAGVNLATATTTVAAPTGRNMHMLLRNSQLSTRDIVAELQYVPKDGGGVQLAWRINVDMKDGAHWYDASVGNDQTAPGQLVNVADWVDNFWNPASRGSNFAAPGVAGGGGGTSPSSFAGGAGSSFTDGTTYNVYPIPIESPLHGSRSLVTNPSATAASPFGWHDTNGVVGVESTLTRGNNVNAQDDTDDNDTGGVSPDGTSSLTFNFPIDFTQNASTYVNASTVNLFFWVNIVHDISFIHGFDEVSGNFQTKNYTNQGLGGDQVEADSQDGSGTNNANFATPPDGQSGREQQYVFDLTNPTRDSSLDGTIVAHEFTHGISNRLTGGPANANALNALQSGGMGEGWGDWMGLMLTQKPGDTANQARGIGMWVLGQPITGVGVRRAPYSFDMTIDPRTLGDFNQSNEPHDAGEAWCSALWDMNWLMINRLGYDPDLYAGAGGNNLALDIVLLGMKLQPANPTFIQARDAILAADQQLTGGDNFDEIWTAFARRGFGLSANCGPDADSTTVVEAFDKPAPPVKIGGTVFNDENANQKFDANEVPLAGWRVYVDANNNNVFDSGERSAVSAVDGSYLLKLFTTGDLTIREVVQPLWKETLPGGDGAYHVTVNSGDNLTNLNFGNQEFPGEIHGKKWNDLNGDAVKDQNEPGIPGIVIYADLNNDSKIGIGEPAAVTDSQGNYTIVNLRPGTYTVREVYQPGLLQTFPDPNGIDLGAHVGVVVTTGAVTPNIDFGNKAAFDYGDAPAPYPTLISQGGAVHGFLQNFYLGAGVDVESDGQPTANADGDDFSGNEIQSVKLPSTTTGGTFTLTFDGQTTAPIAYNATAATVRTALQALTNVGTGQIAVTGGPGPANAWTITFQGTLATRNLLPLKASGLLLTPPGTVTITTVQNGGSDDEDGVVLSSLIPGQIASATVTASVDGFAAGYLQGFVDFNKDGDWNDADEQIFKDVQLTTGTFNLTFPVPATSGLGTTFARFRFSLEHGIGPKGSALGGEVEDYRVTVLGASPSAVDDAFTVDNESFIFQNALNVLANDLPSATGPAGIFAAGLDLTGTQGTVALDDNGTPGVLTDDFYRYAPPSGFIGVDRFKYRDVDPDGNVSAPATVTITVRFVPRDPIAVDNTFDVLVNSAANKFDVMANDVLGSGGAIRLSANTSPTHGSVVVDNNGTPANLNDDFYRYTPTAGFSGDDSFTYTIIDGTAKTSTGKVTIQIATPTRTPQAGAKFQFELQAVDKTTNLPLPDGALVTLGDSILVRGIVTDLRPPSETTDPSQMINFAGAFSAYMDLLYDRSRVQPFGPIVYGGQYQDNKAGFGGTPGLIDEIGAAFSDISVNSPGSSAKLVFTKEFVTTATGIAQFVADPADISPSHDITGFVVDNANPLNSKVQRIPPDQVYYKPSFPTITIISSAEGADTNRWMPVDVNLDGQVSAIDALLVVNYINQNAVPAGGEGEAVDTFKRDVNHDNFISPADALMVINYLNRVKSTPPSGEGEEDSAPLSPLVVSSPSQGSSSSSSSPSSEAAPVAASDVDQVFAQTDWAPPSTKRSEDAPSTTLTANPDDFFTSLGTTGRRNRK